MNRHFSSSVIFGGSLITLFLTKFTKRRDQIPRKATQPHGVSVPQSNCSHRHIDRRLCRTPSTVAVSAFTAIAGAGRTRLVQRHGIQRTIWSNRDTHIGTFTYSR